MLPIVQLSAMRLVQPLKLVQCERTEEGEGLTVHSPLTNSESAFSTFSFTDNLANCFGIKVWRFTKRSLWQTQHASSLVMYPRKQS